MIPLKKSGIISPDTIAAVTMKALGGGHGGSQAIRPGFISRPGKFLVCRNALVASQDMAGYTSRSVKRPIWWSSRGDRAGSPEMAAQAAAAEQVVHQSARVFESGQEFQRLDGRRRKSRPCILLGSPEP